MKKRDYRSALLMVLALILVSSLLSCAPSHPSEADGKRALEEKYENLVKVLSFKETNAQEGEVFGIKIYNMEYKAEIEYLYDVAINYDFLGNVMSIKKGKKGPYDFFMWRDITKGTREKVVGAFTFEKTKKGWR